MNRCYKCDCESGKGPNELRPYGPRGEWVCFRCAFATPEAEEQTKGAFRSQVDAAGPIVLVGEETGPRPYRPSHS